MNTDNAKISKLEHKGEFYIKVEIPYTLAARTKIKAVANRKFSRTHSCWYIPNTFEAIEDLKQYFKIEYLQKINDKKVDNSKIGESVKKVSVKKETKQLKTEGFDIQKNNFFTSPKIILKVHDEEWIRCYVSYDKKGWIEVIKNITGRKWEVKGKYWLLPNVKDTYRLLRKYIGLEHIDIQYDVKADIPDTYDTPHKVKAFGKRKISFYERLNEFQQTAIIQLEQALILKRLSYSTQKTYKHHLAGLFFFHKNIAPDKITIAQVQQYLLHQIKFKKIAESTQNQIINAIKAYWEKVLKRDKTKMEIPRPKKPKKLPNVLSTEEVGQLLSVLENIKHKLLLILIYSAGMRRGEVLNLLKRDINISRRAIHIKGAKGKKDRYVVLAETVIPHLQAYLKQYRPVFWLFEGQNGGKYSATSLQKVFQKAIRISKINPYITLHTLRHSYATHCMEQGHNLKHVQKALGHGSLKTTEIYLHLSSDALRKLKSPIDNMNI